MLLNSWKLFPTARALIGYFKVTWHLTTKLFPAKISERVTRQSLWRQRVTVHCYPRMLSARKIYFHKFAHKNVFLRGLYNRSLKDWSLRKQLIFFPGISMSLGKQDWLFTEGPLIKCLLHPLHRIGISLGNSMICSDIWHKYHEWYFKIVIQNFTSR